MRRHVKKYESWICLLISCGLVTYGGAKLLSGSSSADSLIQTVPASIANDCSVNVSSQLNAWISSVPDGSTLQFNGGCYRIDQTLFLKNRNNLIVDGGGATFKAIDPTGDGSPVSNPSYAARGRSQWSVAASSNITFQNMTVVGANPNAGLSDGAYVVALEAQNAFNIDANTGPQNTNITIHDVTATDTYGDFIYFRGTTNGHVYNSHFERNGRQGISVTGAGPILIENNYLGQTRRATFDLEPVAITVSGVTIRNNTIGPGRLLFVASHGTGVVNDITVTNNTLQGHDVNIDVAGSQTSRRHDWTITNNTSDTTTGSPAPRGVFTFTYTDNVMIANNTQAFAPIRGDYGVVVQSVTGMTVRDNSFVGVAGSVYDFGGSGFIACSNKLTAGGAFDQPIVCPQVVTPPPPSPAPQTPTPPANQPSTPNANSTPASTTSTSKTSALPASNSTTPAANSTHVKPSSNPSAVSIVTAPSSLLKLADSSSANPRSRAGAIGLLYLLIILALMILFFAVRALLRLIVRHHVLETEKDYIQFTAAHTTVISPTDNHEPPKPPIPPALQPHQ